MRSPGRLAVLALAAALAGCSASAPVPPLVEPVAEGPPQYWWPSLKLEPGTQVSYRLQTVRELKSGDDVDVESREHVVRLTARLPTAEARNQVSLAVDGTEAVLLLFDEAGRLHDAVPLKPDALAPAAPFVWGLGLTTRHFAGQTLRVGERRDVGLGWEQIRPLLHLAPDERTEDLAATVPAGRAVRVEFVGYRRLAGRIVTTLQGTMPSFLGRKVKWADAAGTAEVDYLAIEWTEHLDATAGLPVSRYWVTTLGGTLEGRRFTRREISSLLLERWTVPGPRGGEPAPDGSPPVSPGA